MKRIVVKYEEAETMFESLPDNNTESLKKFRAHGGYWQEKKDLWFAFDCDTGDEVLMEYFADEQQASKYASGEMAITIKGVRV